MKFDHKELVVAFAKLVTKAINFTILLACIIGGCFVLYFFYLAVVQQYAPGESAPEGFGRTKNKSSSLEFPLKAFYT